MRQCPYPPDCILIWIYGMQINYITFRIKPRRNRKNKVAWLYCWNDSTVYGTWLRW